jgi:hypothetical protein
VRRPKGVYSVSPAEIGTSTSAFSRRSAWRSSYQGIGSSSQKMLCGWQSRVARTALGRSQPWFASSMIATSGPTAFLITPAHSASASGERPATFTLIVR